MSTTSRSPGSAPSIATGPLSMCATPRLTSRTSLAESLLPICASVHSRHSTRNSLPGLTDDTAGMSGCQRLWPGTAWSAIDLDWSTLKATSGICFLSRLSPGCGRHRDDRPGPHVVEHKAEADPPGADAVEDSDPAGD